MSFEGGEMTRDASCPNCGAPQRWHRYPCKEGGVVIPEPDYEYSRTGYPSAYKSVPSYTAGGTEPIAAGEDADLDVGFGPGVAGEEEPRKPKLSELLADEPRIFPAEPIAAGEDDDEGCCIKCGWRYSKCTCPTPAGEECICPEDVVQHGFHQNCPIHGATPAEPIAAGEEYTNPGARWLAATPAEPAVTELVERLRKFGRYPYRDENKMALEAADTITRLEAKVRTQAAILDHWQPEREEAQATIARHEQTIKEINEAWAKDEALAAALQSERDELKAQLSTLQYQGQDK
jgi:hypothetical protein